MEKYIRKLLLNLGIRSTYQGFRYLQYALLLCLENDEYLIQILPKSSALPWIMLNIACELSFPIAGITAIADS